jgi:predicted RNase H-like nuclease (RuvC/YqgF family)
MSVKPNSVVAPPAKHHFIPQFYQRGFTADKDNRIWVYEKDKEPRRYFVRGTGVKHALYGFTNNRNQFDTETIEKELAKIDNDGAKVIQKLERGNTLKDKERARLCRFVSVMLRRTPKHKEQVDKMAAEMMPSVFDGLDEEWIRRMVNKRTSLADEADRLFEQEKAEFERLREKYMREVPDFLFPGNTVRDSNFEQVMYGMDWAFFKASPGTEFPTCDDPAFFNKGTGLKDRKP